MTDIEDASVTFETHRRRLLGLAYRMLGSLAGAEDAVQEAYLRWHKAVRHEVREPGAWLTTTVTRLCIDELRAARARRESYQGPWLPEPWIEVAEETADTLDHAELADDLSVAFLLMLERLGPEERAALLLHDVFEAAYTDIAAALGRNEAAVRQMVARARQRVATDRKRHPATAEAHRELQRRFNRALQARDQAELLALFHPEAQVVADGGGRVLAALRPISGADRVVRFFLGITRDVAMEGVALHECWVNGAPGFVACDASGAPIGSFGFEVEGGLIHRIFVVRNPDKLGRLPFG
jgi:RNA polymerase sigma-70 factor, ECF subfamily